MSRAAPGGTGTARTDPLRRPVVVGVDASDPARLAVDWAAEVATALGASLHLVHVGAGGGVLPAEPRWLRELGDAAGRAGVDRVERHVVPGPVVDEIVARSRGAGLVVVGSYGEGARSGMRAGIVALDLVEAASCPVAVVRGAAPGLVPRRGGPVVVGTDAASADDPALRLGAELAAALGTGLSAVLSWSDVTEDARGVHRVAADGAAPAAERLDRAVAALRRAHPGLPVQRHVVEDTALRALLEHARGARAVVVGRRGSRDARRWLGSTSRGLVAFAPCPVVVV